VASGLWAAVAGVTAPIPSSGILPPHVGMVKSPAGATEAEANVGCGLVDLRDGENADVK